MSLCQEKISKKPMFYIILKSKKSYTHRYTHKNKDYFIHILLIFLWIKINKPCGMCNKNLIFNRKSRKIALFIYPLIHINIHILLSYSYLLTYLSTISG